MPPPGLPRSRPPTARGAAAGEPAPDRPLPSAGCRGRRQPPRTPLPRETGRQLGPGLRSSQRKRLSVKFKFLPQPPVERSAATPPPPGLGLRTSDWLRSPRSPRRGGRAAAVPLGGVGMGSQRTGTWTGARSLAPRLSLAPVAAAAAAAAWILPLRLELLPSPPFPAPGEGSGREPSRLPVSTLLTARRVVRSSPRLPTSLPLSYPSWSPEKEREKGSKQQPVPVPAAPPAASGTAACVTLPQPEPASRRSSASAGGEVGHAPSSPFPHLPPSLRPRPPRFKCHLIHSLTSRRTVAGPDTDTKLRPLCKLSRPGRSAYLTHSSTPLLIPRVRTLPRKIRAKCLALSDLLRLGVRGTELKTWKRELPIAAAAATTRQSLLRGHLAHPPPTPAVTESPAASILHPAVGQGENSSLRAD
ncbi:wiskott-Aldrich syndrome protein homolog 1-like [Sarcophilus harrisii]|uniref:wiskott-Aldrich syndrome protein homolog 1-like n=1 Tax=Sarcophilus harrisii TaxID=9305 RepID=UPI001301D306|nr:wiskott-Aldrich syndrome protein homolog 1-like [Sarcophilus harrisii]